MLPSLLAALLLAQPAELTPEITRLENGLQVVIVENHTLPLVSVQVWYRVGSASDDLVQPGLCHVTRTLLEHRRDAALRLRAAGVRFASRTLRDACYFAALLPATPEFLEYVLKVESERMEMPPADQPEVDTALRAAAREFGLYPNDAARRAERVLLAVAFPNHPYQTPPGFVAQPLRDLTAKSVSEFLKKWFVPGNATLLIIGDIQPARTVELVHQLFDKLPWVEPPPGPDLAAAEAQQIHLPPLSSAHAGLDIAWVTPALGADANAGLDVLMQRLCNPVDGPLYRRLTEAGCWPPRWQHESWREAGLLVLSVERSREATMGSIGVPPVSGGQLATSAVGDGNDVQNPTGNRVTRPLTPTSAPGTSERFSASDIERIVLDELERAANAVPTEIEFNRARALAARVVRNRWAAFAERALELGRFEAIAGDLLQAEWQVPRLAQTRVRDMQRAAADLRSARMVVLPRGRVLASGGSPERFPQLAPTLKAQPPEQLDSPAALNLLAKCAADAPPIVSPKPPATVSARKLDSGVKVTVYAIAGLEPVAVATLFGPEFADPRAVRALMAVGSTRHSVAEIRDYLSYHGLDLLPLASAARPGLCSRGPATNVPQMMELQAELLRYPNRSEAACAAAVEQTRGFFQRVRQSGWGDESEYYLPPGLIGWMPPTLLTPDARGLKQALDQLAELHNVGVLVVGDVRPSDIFPAAELIWTGWEPGHLKSDTAQDRREAPPAETQPVTALRTDTGWAAVVTRTVQLRVSAWLSPPALEQPLRELALRCVEWSLGCPTRSPTELDGKHAWLWTTLPVDEQAFQITGEPAPNRIAEAAEGCLKRIEQVGFGKLPRQQVEMVLRLTRADRLEALDRASAIGDLLERGVANPWDLCDQLGPQEFGELLPQAFRVRARSVVGSGPGDRSAELKRFEHVPDLPSSAPISR